MSDISVVCSEIQTSVGFVYVLLTSVFNLTLDSDCEQSWLTKVCARVCVFVRVCVPVLKTAVSHRYKCVIVVLNRTGS